MRYNKLALKFLFTFSLCILTVFVAVAQPPDQDDPMNTEVPIDGGLSILLAAGVGYGIKKVRDERKKSRKGTDIIPEK